MKCVPLRVDMVQFQLDRVCVRHEWRSGSDVVEMRITNIEISALVVINKGKFIIFKDGINSGQVQI